MKFAFTLAETLITLVIIGVIAGLTLPSAIQNSIEKRRVAQLKKSYSELSQAFALAIDEYGTPDGWGMGGMYNKNSHYILASNIKKFLKLSEDCVEMPENQARKICGQINNKVKTVANNTIVGLSQRSIGQVVNLSNGATVGFRVYTGECNFNYGEIRNVCGVIVVDVNGSKHPNQNGEDQFSFFLTKDKLVPAGTPNACYKFERACNKTIKSPYPGYDGGSSMYACTAWVLYNENQDYLHCSDLSWNGKRSCK